MPIGITQIDIRSENFDSYFIRQLEQVPNARKELIPKDLALRIWRQNGRVNYNQAIKLNALYKLYILWKLCNKNFCIAIEDETGITTKQVESWVKGRKKRDFTIEAADELVETGSFMLGAKEMVDAMTYMNRLSNSPAYHYLTKLKGIKHRGSNDYKQEIKYLIKVFKNWEANKRGWVNEFGIDVAEACVLMALYDEGDMQGIRIYNDVFKRTKNASHMKIKAAFRTLLSRNMIEKTGTTRDASLRITALGVEILHKILDKYAINC